MNAGRKLRELLAQGRLLQAPGVADAMSARVVAAEGYEALYMTGSGTAAMRLGQPDIGLLTMSEMVDNARRIADATELPLIADADTGYGNALNVRRTVQEFERAGVGAIHIEDQQWPKRCGHFAGKTLIAATDMVSHIHAALDARRDADFLIIARTDAYSVEGFAGALERAALYAEAGADMLFIEELRTPAELGAAAAGSSVPLLYNMGGSGKTPFLPPAEIERLGYSVVIYPNFLMRAQILAAQGLLRSLREAKSLAELDPLMVSWKARHDLLGMAEVARLQERYGAPATEVETIAADQ